MPSHALTIDVAEAEADDTAAPLLDAGAEGARRLGGANAWRC
jgi:hypothetical protein